MLKTYIFDIFCMLFATKTGLAHICEPVFFCSGNTICLTMARRSQGPLRIRAWGPLLNAAYGP